MTFTLWRWELSHAQGLEHIQPEIQQSSQSCSCCVRPELALLVGPSFIPVQRDVLSKWELFLDFHSQSLGANTSEHKPQGSGSPSPMTHGNNQQLLFMFVLFCLAVWHFHFSPSVFRLSMPSKMVFPACSPVLLYHHKVGKAEWCKIGDGNVHQRLGRNQEEEACLTWKALRGRWARCSRHLSTSSDAYTLPNAWLQFRFIRNPANYRSSLKTTWDLWLTSLFYFILRKQRKTFKEACTQGIGTLASWLLQC